MNVHDDYLARLDLYDPLRLRNIPLDVKVITPIPNDVMTHCQQEIAAKAQIFRPSVLPKEIQRLTSGKSLLADYHDDIARAMFGAKYGTTKGGEAYETK